MFDCPQRVAPLRIPPPRTGYALSGLAALRRYGRCARAASYRFALTLATRLAVVIQLLFCQRYSSAL
jgi:hypothetical protein